MALVNLAYERGDQRAIEKIIREFGEDPEAIVGEDTASRIVKAIRRIAQLRRRLAEVQQEVEVLKKSEIFQLKQTVEKAETMGSDPLGDLAETIDAGNICAPGHIRCYSAERCCQSQLLASPLTHLGQTMSLFLMVHGDRIVRRIDSGHDRSI